eukprot:gene3832-6342_t
MRLKELEGYLQRVRPFKDPKILLEQYPTSPHIASHLLYTMESTYADIDGKVVCDLGVGCGILAIGCAMLGAGLVIGCDIDKDALEIAQHNAGMLEIDNLELVHLDIGSRPGSHLPPLPLMRADTVVMNPPFGTKKNAGIDMNFLEQASRRRCQDFGLQMEVVAELRFDVPQMYKFHKKKSVDVEVDFCRFSRTIPLNN